MKQTLLLTLILLAAAALPGCNMDWLNKQVNLTFENQTDDQLSVYLNGPGEGTGLLGTMEPKGIVATTLKIRKRELPRNYTWSAGPYKGAFNIWKGTPQDLPIAVGKAGESDTLVDETK